MIESDELKRLAEAKLEQMHNQKPVAWVDAEGDVYKDEPAKNWCPPHTPLYASPVIAGPVADATLAELMAEQKRLDWALAHEAAFQKGSLSWVNSVGSIEMRAVPVGAVRETIDVLMQEVG